MVERRHDRGFTLIEIIVAMAVLAVMATALMPVAAREISAAKRKATESSMEALVRGMVGDPSTGEFGYLGDMGALPTRLEDLADRGKQPGYVVDKNDGVGAGWNGPYVDNAGAPGASVEDGWGQAFRYDNKQAQLRSAGVDQKFDTADDLVYPDAAPKTDGQITVVVKGLSDDGSPPVTLGSGDAEVYVGSAVNGKRKEQKLGGGGPFTLANVPYGIHGLRIEGLGKYKGVVARDVVELRSGNRSVSLGIAAPAGGKP